MASLYSVILPTYNEKQNLPLLICLLYETFTSHGLNFEILVVDDNSPDGTAAEYERLRENLKDRKRLRLLNRPGKLGLGSAYIEGLRETKGNFVFLMDADFSHHPKFIPNFIEKQKEHDYDVVTGSRYIPGGGVHGWNIQRKVISRGANFLGEVMYFSPIEAKNSFSRGLTSFTHPITYLFSSWEKPTVLRTSMFKRHVLESLMPNVRSRGYAFQMEIVVRAKALGFSVGELPITFVDRVYGESKLACPIEGHFASNWGL
ncbi:hypothetical protein Esti_001989 [Eimeria stiedai]